MKDKRLETTFNRLNEELIDELNKKYNIVDDTYSKKSQQIFDDTVILVLYDKLKQEHETQQKLKKELDKLKEEMFNVKTSKELD